MRIVSQILKFKGIVYHHFGVQPAVCRLIDVLEKQTVQMFAYRNPLFALIERIPDHKKVSSLFSFLQF